MDARRPNSTSTLPPPDACVRRCLDGDVQAFGFLYDHFAADVHRFLRSLRLPLEDQDLEDATQEAFLRLFQRLTKCKPSRVKSYVFGIARNVAVDLSRRPRPKREHAGSRDGEPSALDLTERSERQALVARALAEIEPESSTVLGLRHQAGLTMTELADALECSVPTARSRLNSATRKLAIELRRLGVEPRDQRP